MRGIVVAWLIGSTVTGCDLIEFVSLENPPPEEMQAAVLVDYVHGDSLHAELLVQLSMWPEAIREDVLLDGVPLPVTSRSGVLTAFVSTWTIADPANETLPQVVRVPDPIAAATDIEFPLPVLVRMPGSENLCHGSGDVVLEYAFLGPDLEQAALARWDVHASAADREARFSGEGAPIAPVVLPSALLGSDPDFWTVELRVSVGFIRREAGQPETALVANPRARWTIPPCP